MASTRKTSEDLLMYEYMDFVKATSIHPQNVAHEIYIHGMNEEAGECAGKRKKFLRGDYDEEEYHKRLLMELGDTLWYLIAAAESIGKTLPDVMKANMQKLINRRERDAMRGDGDNR